MKNLLWNRNTTFFNLPPIFFLMSAPLIGVFFSLWFSNGIPDVHVSVRVVLVGVLILTTFVSMYLYEANIQSSVLILLMNMGVVWLWILVDAVLGVHYFYSEKWITFFTLVAVFLRVVAYNRALTEKELNDFEMKEWVEKKEQTKVVTKEKAEQERE